MSLIDELKRRNVFRVGAAYLVVAWLLVEISDTIFPRLGLPEWTVTFVIALLLLGLPLALFLAWAFELTPEGVKRTEDVEQDASVTPQTRRAIDKLILVGMVVVVAVIVADRFLFKESGQGARDLPVATAGVAEREATASESATGAGGSRAQSQSLVEASGGQPVGAVSVAAEPPEASGIAVLPFVNMSPDPENAYFADGISEELLNILAGIDGLKVASRTSAFSFKDTNTPIPEIAGLLGVRHVLEGSVRKQGNRVRITAQLIEAGDDAHLWSESYDRNLDDIFKVQEEIAQAITLALGDVLGTRRVTVQAATANLEAYERFLSGRARFHQRTELDEAIADLEYATQHDPGFAEAWIYLAAAHAVSPGYPSARDVSYETSQDAARSALARAKTLLPGHPLVLALRGNIEAVRDRLAALTLLERAARLRSQDSTPTLWHGLELLQGGYIDEAIVVLERAHRMDPRVGINSAYLGLSYLAAGRDN